MGFIHKLEDNGVGRFLTKMDPISSIPVRERHRKEANAAKDRREEVAKQTEVARKQQAALLLQARAAAEEQANLILRDKATKEAGVNAEKPLDTADVKLSGQTGPDTETAVSTRTKKRRQFGFDTSGAAIGGSYSPGVNL